uniref:Uncharacterized protein n=1 Tax=Anguilla anguilla TaxID=7936 RepID=A0A0E9QJH2_ANGAN
MTPCIKFTFKLQFPIKQFTLNICYCCYL